MKSGFVSVLSIAFCAAVCCAPRLYADSSKWVEVKSPHFSVVTDAGEKRGRDVAVRFEQMRSVYGALMTKGRVNLSVPLQIVAFRNSKEFRDFVPLWQGKPAHVAGLFQPGQDRCFIMLDLSVENPWQVVFHEYAHQLMNANLNFAVEPWFEEGFAEYFSTIEVDDKQARVGKPSENAYRVLQQMGRMKIADLFRVQHDSRAYNEGDRQTVFYAESNMMVHYLYDKKLIPQVNQYFNLRRKNVSVEDAIQQAFAMTPSQFDKAFDAYLRAGQYVYYPIPTPPDIVSSGYTAAALDAADSAAVLADAHLHSPDYQDKAIEEFQAILKTNPDNAAALRGLGYAYLQKRQYDSAADYFHRAAALNSQDPRVHYYSAMLLSREGSFTDRAHLPEMINDLETAIALDPNFADPYMLLGFAQFYNGDKVMGLGSMQKALALSPRNEMYQYNLGQMYMADRQFDQALALLHGLQATQDPDLAARVKRSIDQVEQFQSMLQQRASRVAVEHPAAASSSSDEESSAQGAARSEAPSTASTSGAQTQDSRPIQYIQGVIKGVDCSAPPSAVITLVAGTGSKIKVWRMKIADTSKLMLRSGDTFSCSWMQQKAGVNYRSSSDSEGDVVWVGLQ
jgi:tetratricopeptide (TPR) repeat protein